MDWLLLNLKLYKEPRAEFLILGVFTFSGLILLQPKFLLNLMNFPDVKINLDKSTYGGKR